MSNTDFSLLFSIVDDLESNYPDPFFENDSSSIEKFKNSVAHFKEFLNQYKFFEAFLSDKDVRPIAEILDKILMIYDFGGDRAFTDEKKRIHDLIQAIDSLPDLSKLYLKTPEKVDEYLLADLVTYMDQRFGIFSGRNPWELFTHTAIHTSHEALAEFIHLYNSLVSANSGTNEISKILGIIRKYDALVESENIRIAFNELEGIRIATERARQDNAQVEHNKKVLLEEETALLKTIADLEIKRKKVDAYITSKSTSTIGGVFKSEASGLDTQISDLLKYILRCFTLIIFFLLAIGAYILAFPEFIIERIYIIYLSIFLTLTGFVTFLIKERSRLLKYQDYCKISHNEIAALADYTAQLNDKDKIEDLKIQLAYRYFQGPNSQGQQSNDTQDLNLYSSKLGEITKSLKDVKDDVKSLISKD